MKTLKKCLSEVSDKDLSESTKEAIMADAVQIRSEGLAEGQDANIKAIDNMIKETEREKASIETQVKFQIGEKPKDVPAGEEARKARLKSAMETFEMPGKPDPKTLPQTSLKVGEMADMTAISSGKMAHGTHQTEVEGAEDHTWLDMSQANTDEKKAALNDVKEKVVSQLDSMGLPNTAQAIRSQTHKSGSDLYDAIRKAFSRSPNTAESASHLLFDSGIVGSSFNEGTKTNYSVFDTEYGLTENAASEIRAVQEAARAIYKWLETAGLPKEVLESIDLQISNVISLEGKNIEKSAAEWGEDIVNALGATTPTVDGLRALIEVSKQQDKKQMQDTTYHEAFHVAMMWLIPENQRSAVLKRFGGNEESAAVAYAKYVARRELGKKVLQKMPKEVRQVFDLLYKALSAISRGLRAQGYTTPRHFFDNIYMGRYMPEFRLQNGATAMAAGKQSKIITSIADTPRYILLGKDKPQPGKEELDQMTANEQVATFQKRMTHKRIPVLVNPFEADLDAQRVIMKKGEYGLSPEGQRYLKWVEAMRGKSALHPNSKTILSLDLSTECPKRIDPCLYCYVEQTRTGRDIGMWIGHVKEPNETPYRREILTMPKDVVDLMNKIGGLRLFSFGDYRPLLDFDNTSLVLIDAEAKGLWIKAITKQPEFIHTFGDSPNLRVNISIDALPRVMSNAPSLKQAIDLKAGRDHIKIRSVAINEKQARKFAENEDVDVVTLYHGPTGEKLQAVVAAQNKKLVKQIGKKKMNAELDKWQNMRPDTIIAKKLQVEFPEKICCQTGTCGGDRAKCGFGLSQPGAIIPNTIIPESKGTKLNIAPPNNKNFKRWFGNSKVVDQHGAPLIVYHGGVDIAGAEAFDEDFGEMTTGNNAVGAFHFTDTYDVAEDYSRQGFIRRYEDYPEGLVEDGIIAEEKEFEDYDDQYGFVAELAEERLETVAVYLQMENPIEIDMEGGDVDTEKLEALRKFAKTGVDENSEFIDEYYELMYAGFDQEEIEGYREEIEELARENFGLNEDEEVEDYMFTESTIEFMDENGYYPDEKKIDGIIVRNVVDSIGEMSHQVMDEFIVFEPTQVKSIENEGMWDGSNPNTRLNIIGTSRARKGPLDSKAFKKWFGDSKVVDRFGAPEIVYHGTGEVFGSFDIRDIGYHFGTSEQATNRLSVKTGDLNIMPVYLSMKKPVAVFADPHDWMDVAKVAGVLFDARPPLPDGGAGKRLDFKYWKANSVEEIREDLMSKGYDGIIYPNFDEGKGSSYIAFKPEQIKSVYNEGSWDGSNPDTRLNIIGTSRARKKPFYSKMADIISGSIKEMPAKHQSVKKWLERQDVKPAEMKWMGLDTWLDEQKSLEMRDKNGTILIDRKDLLNFLKQNEIRLTEKILGEQERDTDEIADIRERIINDERENAYDYMIEDITMEYDVKHIDGLNPVQLERIPEEYNPKHYTGNAYYIMDKEAGVPVEDGRTLEDSYIMVFDEASDATNYLREMAIEQTVNMDAEDFIDMERVEEQLESELDERGIKVGTEYHDYQLGGEKEDYREMMFHYKPSSGKVFDAPHFEESQGLLFHLRFNTRDIEGDNSLFIEELQSDWHTEGRRQGYQGKEAEEKQWIIVNNEGVRYASGYNFYTKQQADDYIDASSTMTTDEYRATEITVIVKDKGVPKAPFSDNWHEVAFKRMLRYATDNNFDRIGWTTGAQQIERWKSALRQKVDELNWKDKSGWMVFRKDRPMVLGQDKATFADKEDAEAYLDSVIEADDQKNYSIEVIKQIVLRGVKGGENVFEHIVPMKGETEIQGQKASLVGLVGKDIAQKITKSPAKGAIKGEDITIGGQGLRSLYDEKLVGFANRYGGQWGAKVEKKLVDAGADVEFVHSMPINEAMRQDIAKKPQTLFRIGKKVPPIFNEIWDMKRKTMVDRVKEGVDSVHDRDTREHARNVLIQKTLDKKHFIKYRGAEKSYRQHSAATGISSIFDTFFHDGLLEMTDDGTIVKKDGTQGFMPWMEENLGEDWEEFLIWVAAKRSKELEKEDRENLMTDEKRKQVFAETRSENDAEWERLADELHVINKTFLDIAEKAGLINAKSRAKWEQHYYIPFHRIFEDEKERALFLSKPDKLDSQIKHLVGSELKLEHPLNSMTKTWMHLLGESMRNVAQKSAFDFFMDTESGLVEEMKDVDVITKVDVNTGNVMHTAARGVDVENILSFLDGGKIRYFKVNDINLFNAMSNLNSYQMGRIAKVLLGWPKNILTYGATFGVGFRIRNLIRDTMHVAMLEKSFMPFADSLKGFMRAWKNDPEYQEMKASGFSFGGSYTRAGNPKAAADYIRKKVGKKKRQFKKKNIILNSVSDMFEWWEKVGENAENAARIQLYSKLRAEGLSIQEAGYRAKDLLDFSKSGQMGIVQFLVQTVPFLNARMQGMYKLGQTAFSEDKATQKNFFIRGTMLALASLALWAINRDDDDYKALEDWEKWTYYHVFIGDHHIWIPKPFEVGAMASTLVEVTADVAYGNEDAGYMWDALKDTIGQTFAVGPPQLIVPAIELYSNKSLFTGRPILSEAMKKLPPGERFEPWTPRLLQLSGRLGISPKETEQLMRSTLGAIATTVFLTTDAVLLPFFPVAPEKKWHQYPIANLFYENLKEPQKNVKHLTRFYEAARDLNEISQGITHMKHTGRRVEAVKAYEKNKDKLRYRKSFLRLQKSISKINKKMKLIMVDPNMDAAQKDAAIDKWLKIRNQKVKAIYDKLDGKL